MFVKCSTGLYDYGFRDYMPQAARFTTSDPIRDGNNWFSYVNHDPVNWIDLWGLEPFANGETRITAEGEFPNSGARYVISIIPSLSARQPKKIDIITSIDVGTPYMPQYKQITTFTYENAGRMGQVSITGTNIGINPGDRTGMPTTDMHPQRTGGQGDDIILPTGTSVADITEITTTLIITGTGETVTELFTIRSPKSNCHG